MTSYTSRVDDLLAKESEDGLTLTLIMNRPTRGNSFSPDMLLEMRRLLALAKTHPTARAIVLTGTGKYFCSGMDLSAKSQSNVRSDPQALTREFVGLCNDLRTHPLPVISALNGPALGGGTVLLFVADITIALSTSFIQFAEVRRGMIPAMISTFITPRVGEALVKDWFLTGRKIPVERLYSLGLLTSVVEIEGERERERDIEREKEDLNREVQLFVSHFVRSAPNAISVCKDLINFEASTVDHAAMVDRAGTAFAMCVRGKEMRYGIGQFARKKEPDWKPFRESMAESEREKQVASSKL